MARKVALNFFIISLILLTINSCQLRQQSDSNENLEQISLKLNQKILDNIYINQNNFKLCESEIDKSLSKNASSVYKLNNQEYLVQILCFLGAYQGNYQYFLYKIKDSKEEIKPLYFQQFSQEKDNKIQLKNTLSLGGSPNYDEESQILTIYTKGRGLADCGSFAQYKWENSQFILIEYRLKEQCDGNYLEPENYPKIYP